MVMAAQIKRPFGSIVLVIALLMSWVGTALNTARAGDCLAAPNSPAPLGSHWYYRLDWATQRKCWYVRTLDQSVKQAAPSATKERASPLYSVPAPAKPKPTADGAPSTVRPGDASPPSPPLEVIAIKPNDASVGGATTDETTSSIPEVSAPLQEATSSKTIAEAAASASNAAPLGATTNETASSSPKESAPEASASSEFSSEPAPGTAVAAPAESRGDEPLDNAKMPMKPFLFIVTLGLVVLGISFAVPKLFKNETNKIRATADVEVGEIAASIASKLARNRDDSAESNDWQQAEGFVLNEANSAYEDERLDESAAPKRVTPQISPPTISEEYWAKADACLSWAREAPTDEVRLGCLALAKTWLSVALRNGSGAPPTLPRAPTL